MRKNHFHHNSLAYTLSLCAVFLCVTNTAAAQPSSCSSDGQKPPVALLERFINADCDTCWANNTLPVAKQRELVLDWIVPSAKEDEAPLSNAAVRDASRRLQEFKAVEQTFKSNQQAHVRQTNTTSDSLSLRVALGQVVSGYVGASLELRGINAANLAKMEAFLGQEPRLFLALIETLPAGTEGSDAARNLVRNVLEPRWNLRYEFSKTKPSVRRSDPMVGKAFLEFRPMQVPQGARNERLRVVGWLENARGQIVTIAESVCK
jgi:hypothetical protein